MRNYLKKLSDIFYENPHILILGLIISIALLLIPLPEKAPLAKTIEDTAHIPLFGLITCIILIFFTRTSVRCLRPLNVAVISFVIAVAIGVGSEFLQDLLGNGRELEIKDMLDDIIGAFVVAVYWFTSQPVYTWQKQWRTCLRIGSFITLIVPVIPVVNECILLVYRDHIFPVICSFEQPFEMRFIKGVYGTVLHRGPPPNEWQQNQSHYVGCAVVNQSQEHTGIALSNIQSDWSCYRYLSFKVFTYKQPFSTISIWFLDGAQRKQFKKRVMCQDTLKDGENCIKIAFSAIAPDTLNPPLDIKSIKKFGFYFNGIKDTFTVWVDDFQLENPAK